MLDWFVPGGWAAAEGEGRCAVVPRTLVLVGKAVGDSWEIGWGAGGGGYKHVAAAVGVGRTRLVQN